MTTLQPVTPFRRLLAALLFPGILALWLAPSAHAIEGTPSAHAPGMQLPTAAIDASPTTVGVFGEIEAPEDDRHPPPCHQWTTRRPSTLWSADGLDRSTRDRSAGPIYIVRRSGQAHRSAP